MESYELLREVFDRAGPKKVADDLGLSVSLMYKWAEPAAEAGSGSPNPMDRVAALLKSTGDPDIAQWVCERAGGFNVPNPAPEGKRSYTVLPATNQVVQEFARMLSVVANAALDGKISLRETREIRTQWEQLKSVTEGFVRDCEEGNFDRIMREDTRE